jgi:hypothetical protein
MAGHLVYIALLVCFTAVSVALGLIAMRVIGRLTRMDSHDLNTWTLVNAVVTLVIVVMMLTTPNFDNDPLSFLLSSLIVGFVMPVFYLLGWSICALGVKLVRLIDGLMGENSKE